MYENKTNVPSGLPPAQENFIAAIAGGATLQAAADAAGIHRNTISYWRRTSYSFRDALNHAQYDKALFTREQAEAQVTEAYAAIHAILINPDASDTARLNAAKYIIEMASTPPPPKPEPIYHFETLPSPLAAKPENTHSPAQTPPSQTVHTTPKIGRNELCPCGSTLKFKRCCLGKPHPAATAAASVG